MEYSFKGLSKVKKKKGFDFSGLLAEKKEEETPSVEYNFAGLPPKEPSMVEKVQGFSQKATETMSEELKKIAKYSKEKIVQSPFFDTFLDLAKTGMDVTGMVAEAGKSIIEPLSLGTVDFEEQIPGYKEAMKDVSPGFKTRGKTLGSLVAWSGTFNALAPTKILSSMAPLQQLSTVTSAGYLTGWLNSQGGVANRHKEGMDSAVWAAAMYAASAALVKALPRLQEISDSRKVRKKIEQVLEAEFKKPGFKADRETAKAWAKQFSRDMIEKPEEALLVLKDVYAKLPEVDKKGGMSALLDVLKKAGAKFGRPPKGLVKTPMVEGKKGAKELYKARRRITRIAESKNLSGKRKAQLIADIMTEHYLTTAQITPEAAYYIKKGYAVMGQPAKDYAMYSEIAENLRSIVHPSSKYAVYTKKGITRVTGDKLINMLNKRQSVLTVKTGETDLIQNVILGVSKKKAFDSAIRKTIAESSEPYGLKQQQQIEKPLTQSIEEPVLNEQIEETVKDEFTVNSLKENGYSDDLIEALNPEAAQEIFERNLSPDAVMINRANGTYSVIGEQAKQAGNNRLKDIVDKMSQGQLPPEEQKKTVKYMGVNPVTGLANKMWAQEEVEDNLSELKEGGISFVGLGAIDLNQFKAVNDSKGHAYGDHILREVAMEMEKTVELDPDLSLFHGGGDEFYVVGRDKTKTEMNKILASIKRNVEANGEVQNIRKESPAFGISYGSHSIGEWTKGSFSELWQESDQEMYSMKKRVSLPRRSVTEKAEAEAEADSWGEYVDSNYDYWVGENFVEQTETAHFIEDMEELEGAARDLGEKYLAIEGVNKERIKMFLDIRKAKPFFPTKAVEKFLREESGYWAVGTWLNPDKPENFNKRNHTLQSYINSYLDSYTSSRDMLLPGATEELTEEESIELFLSLEREYREYQSAKEVVKQYEKDYEGKELEMKERWGENFMDEWEAFKGFGRYGMSEPSIAYNNLADTISQFRSSATAALNEVAIKGSGEKAIDSIVEMGKIALQRNIERGVKFNKIDIRNIQVTSPAEIASLFHLLFSKNIEGAHVVLLDNEGIILFHTLMTMGVSSSVDIPRQALQDVKNFIVKNTKASKMLLIHNHPSGNVSASVDDKNAVKVFAQELENIDVEGIIIDSDKATHLLPEYDDGSISVGEGVFDFDSSQGKKVVNFGSVESVADAAALVKYLPANKDAVSISWVVNGYLKAWQFTDQSKFALEEFFELLRVTSMALGTPKIIISGRFENLREFVDGRLMTVDSNGVAKPKIENLLDVISVDKNGEYSSALRDQLIPHPKRESKGIYGKGVTMMYEESPTYRPDLRNPSVYEAPVPVDLEREKINLHKIFMLEPAPDGSLFSAEYNEKAEKAISESVGRNKVFQFGNKRMDSFMDTFFNFSRVQRYDPQLYRVLRDTYNLMIAAPQIAQKISYDIFRGALGGLTAQEQADIMIAVQNPDYRVQKKLHKYVNRIRGMYHDLGQLQQSMRVYTKAWPGGIITEIDEAVKTLSEELRSLKPTNSRQRRYLKRGMLLEYKERLKNLRYVQYDPVVRAVVESKIAELIREDESVAKITKIHKSISNMTSKYKQRTSESTPIRRWEEREASLRRLLSEARDIEDYGKVLKLEKELNLHLNSIPELPTLDVLLREEVILTEDIQASEMVFDYASRAMERLAFRRLVNYMWKRGLIKHESELSETERLKWSQLASITSSKPYRIADLKGYYVHRLGEYVFDQLYEETHRKKSGKIMNVYEDVATLWKIGQFLNPGLIAWYDFTQHFVGGFVTPSYFTSLPAAFHSYLTRGHSNNELMNRAYRESVKRNVFQKPYMGRVAIAEARKQVKTAFTKNPGMLTEIRRQLTNIWGFDIKPDRAIMLLAYIHYFQANLTFGIIDPVMRLNAMASALRQGRPVAEAASEVSHFSGAYSEITMKMRKIGHRTMFVFMLKPLMLRQSGAVFTDALAMAVDKIFGGNSEWAKKRLDGMSSQTKKARIWSSLLIGMILSGFSGDLLRRALFSENDWDVRTVQRGYRYLVRKKGDSNALWIAVGIIFPFDYPVRWVYRLRKPNPNMDHRFFSQLEMMGKQEMSPFLVDVLEAFVYNAKGGYGSPVITADTSTPVGAAKAVSQGLWYVLSGQSKILTTLNEAYLRDMRKDELQHRKEQMQEALSVAQKMAVTFFGYAYISHEPEKRARTLFRAIDSETRSAINKVIRAHGEGEEATRDARVADLWEWRNSSIKKTAEFYGVEAPDLNEKAPDLGEIPKLEK